MSPCSRLRFRALLARTSLLIVLAAPFGCDVPTELPIFDIRWVLPIEVDSIPVDSLLPLGGGVTVAGGNFNVDVDSVLLTQTLGGLCGPPCVAADGFTVPKPAFGVAYNQIGNLPTDVVSVELVSGSISLAIDNKLSFDPIRPAPASPGTFTVTLYETDMNGRQLGQVLLDGTTDSLPTMSVTTVPLPLAAGTITTAVFTEVDLVSPAGDPVVIGINDTLIVKATVGTLVVSSVTLDVDGRAVSIGPKDADVGNISEDITERIQNGSLVLDIQNPFGVGISMVFDISGPSTPLLQRAVSISSAATSTVTLSYTGDEFRTFLGQPNVQITGAGNVVAPGGPVTFTATQVLVIEITVDLVLEVS